jgi:hypothetical protein
MISTTRSRSILSEASLLALFLIAPLQAFAAVQITEVMYDAPGADQGHEWVELTNTSSSTVSIAGWKFFEGGTNHNFVVAQGTDSTSSPQATTLLPGQSAIISNNPSDFLSDFPKYAGTLFKSSFSLNNTGETIALKDAKLNIVDSLAYASTQGAAGDGNTLHLTASGLIAGAPDPGVYSLTPPKPISKPAVVAAAPVQKSATASSKSSSSRVASPSSNTQPAIVFQAAHNLPLPQASSWMWYAVGGAALVLMGIAGILYLRLQTLPSETSPRADEFDIE